MQNEIGSEFCTVPVTISENGFFRGDTKWFQSGRTALRYIIKDIRSKKNIHSAALPAWCCETMVIPFLEAGINVEFYPVYMKNKRLVQETERAGRTDIILVMDYFGYTSDADYGSYPGTVIRDMTHSLFSKKYVDADYYFGSLRKWCGFYTGGYAWTDDTFSVLNDGELTEPEEYIRMRRLAMEHKQLYLEGRLKEKNYLDEFALAEKMLEREVGIYPAGRRDIMFAKALNIDFIKKKRRENAGYLLNRLQNMAVFQEIRKDDCPMFVPVLTDDRDRISRKLTEAGIYCPKHWPLSEYQKPDGKSRELYDREISIVCDQRYTVSDMQRICDVLLEGEA